MIHQPLAFGALDGPVCALGVIHAMGDAVIPAERQFINVALQMMLAHGMMRAVHLPLHKSVEAFRGVHVNEATEPSHIRP